MDLKRSYVAFFTIAILAASLYAAKAPGRITVNVAVLNYEPIMENRGGVPYWQACGWTDPRDFITMITEGVRKATDNVILMDVVHWTNVDMYPYCGTRGRYLTDEMYWDGYQNGWAQAGITDDKLSTPGYMMAMTNDFPHIPGMIDRGEIDHCIMFGGPYFGYWETIMLGKGAYRCNSSPAPLATERLFVINGPNVERPGSTLHNYCHGLGENILGYWFLSGTISTIGNDRYRNIAAPVNDVIRFTRCKHSTNEVFSEIHVGTCHMPPNGDIDAGWGYDYSDPNPVPCYADRWIDFPDNTNAPSRMISMSDWGGGDDNFQAWWWNHVPRFGGFQRGRINNWLTYAWNQMKAAYPVGSDQPVQMNNVDLRGWYAFEFYAPPGTTQMVISARAGTNVYFGLRKDYVPFRFRYGTEGAYDDWPDTQVTAYTRTLDTANNYGKGLEGYWYLTFGKRVNLYTWDDTVYDADISVTILPRPTNTTAAVTVSEPSAGVVYDYQDSITNRIAWSVDGLPQGIRSYQLAYQLTNGISEWIPLCEDYHYQLASPYIWYLPKNVKSHDARVRIIAEDVYGTRYTNYSEAFYVNIPEPAAAPILAMFMLRQVLFMGKKHKR